MCLCGYKILYSWPGLAFWTFNVPVWSFDVPHWTMNLPTWTFNVPHSSFRVPVSTINMPDWTFDRPTSTINLPYSSMRVAGWSLYNHLFSLYVPMWSQKKAMQPKLHRLHTHVNETTNLMISISFYCWVPLLIASNAFCRLTPFWVLIVLPESRSNQVM